MQQLWSERNGLVQEQGGYQAEEELVEIECDE
jgi:hypothetical protein